MKIGKIFFIFFIFSCNHEKKDSVVEFYSRTKFDNDLYRLPLIYPYEINTFKGLKYFAILNQGNLSNDFNIDGHLDSVNIIDSSIIMFGKIKFKSKKFDYLIILNMKEVYPLNKNKFRKVKDSLNLKIELLGVFDIYNNWCEFNKLPWRDSLFLK